MRSDQCGKFNYDDEVGGCVNAAETRRLVAEQRRTMDLHQILERRSREGVHPIQIAPEEIWRIILNELDPIDKLHMSEVHDIFSQTMEAHRNRDILLPLVMNVNHFMTVLNSDSANNLFDAIMLREVSKSARDSFDTRIEDELLSRCRGEDKQPSPYTVCLSLNDCDKPRHDPLKLLASFADNDDCANKTKFFPRSVVVDFADNNNDDDDGIEEDEDEKKYLYNHFIVRVSELFEAIGNDIWHLEFSVPFNSNTSDFVDVFHFFLHIVSYTTNLKWLVVNINLPSEVVGTPELATFAASCSFPCFPNLIRLDFNSGEGFHILHESILRANPHITRLRLSESSEVSNDTALAHPSLIRDLPLSYFSVYDDYYRYDDDVICDSLTLDRVVPILNSNWQLHTIVLSLKNVSLSRSFSGLKGKKNEILLFHVLGNFQTLKKVDLLLEKSNITDSVMMEFLNLPNLEDLSIRLDSPDIEYNSNTNFFFSLQFLYRCENLKKLSWMMSGVDGDKLSAHLKFYEEEQVINFRAGLRCVYQSNTWNFFSQLEEIYVAFYVENYAGPHGSDYTYCRAIGKSHCK